MLILHVALIWVAAVVLSAPLLMFRPSRRFAAYLLGACSGALIACLLLLALVIAAEGLAASLHLAWLRAADGLISQTGLILSCVIGGLGGAGLLSSLSRPRP